MKTVSFVMTGPSTLDAGSFVAVVDDEGNRIDDKVGWWEHDGRYHRFVMPVELVPRLSGAMQAVVEETRRSFGDPKIDAVYESELQRAIDEPLSNAGMTARNKLKERFRKAAPNQKKGADKMSIVDAGAVPSHWEKCPSCGDAFDPQKDELLDCGQCGEPKCTAACMKDPARPCVDCAALQAGPNEGGFDPTAAPPSLFNKGFSAETIANAAAKGELPDDEDEDD